jgi:hypothetical protein
MQLADYGEIDVASAINEDRFVVDLLDVDGAD